MAFLRLVDFFSVYSISEVKLSWLAASSSKGAKELHLKMGGILNSSSQPHTYNLGFFLKRLGDKLDSLLMKS